MDDQKTDQWDQSMISVSASILDALKKIDSNRRGFLIVVDESQRVCGTLTDGDIRRAFIRGEDVQCRLDRVYTHDFRYLLSTDDISAATELFKTTRLTFIPILDGEGRLYNIVTRGKIHALLLHDIHADLSYDFFNLDERIVDDEIYYRPWGFYKTTLLNKYFQSKVISVKPCGRLSLQSHEHREEYWVVVHGEGTVQLEQSFLHVRCGSTLFIPKGTRHRLTNTSTDQSLVVTEIQIGEYLGEDDIVRYEDEYGRVCQSEGKQ